MKSALSLGTFLLLTCLNADTNKSSYGTLSGQIRSYTLIEDNQSPLHDYDATAIGGKIQYRSPIWNNLQGHAAIYTSHFIYDNISSSSVEPRASNRNSRYAIGLVDTTDYDARSVTDLGEAAITLYDNKNFLMIGRMKLDTPFVNPQDGRMIPTLEQGIWGKLILNEQISAQAGFINAFWNRNTDTWKSVEDSLGYGYEMGNAALSSTTPSNYLNHTSSDGLFIANLRYTPTPLVRLDLWEYYLENIFNLFYTEGFYSHILGEFKCTYALQALYQSQVGDGGNSEDNFPSATNAQKAKSYIQEGEHASAYGLKSSLAYRDSIFTLAYNRITDKGRFLFPREWGKEPFFTFQKRERSEGSGNSHAWMTSLEHNFKNGADISLSYGYYHRSDPKEWLYNKYGTPSYIHYNIDLFYRFSGVFKGLKAEYLLTRKEARGNTYQIPGPTEYNFIFRKNNMTLHNIIFNYDF